MLSSLDERSLHSILNLGFSERNLAWTDQELLDSAEGNVVSTRSILLQLNPLKGSFDSQHLKAIHSYSGMFTSGQGNSGRSRWQGWLCSLWASPPGLLGRCSIPDHVPGRSRLAHFDAQREQLARMRTAPQRGLARLIRRIKSRRSGDREGGDHFVHDSSKPVSPKTLAVPKRGRFRVSQCAGQSGNWTKLWRSNTQRRWSQDCHRRRRSWLKRCIRRS